MNIAKETQSCGQVHKGTSTKPKDARGQKQITLSELVYPGKTYPWAYPISYKYSFHFSFTNLKEGLDCL